MTSLKSIPRNSLKSHDSEIVQFFNNSSSEFSESVISERCLESLRYEIYLQNDAIFQTLRETLVPRQDYNEQQKIEHIIHRAELLHRESFPQFAKLVERRENTEEIKGEIAEIQSDLRKLIRDYQNYRADQLSFDDFYNRYGAIKNINFGKKEQGETVVLNILGDEIKVINDYPTPKNLFRSSNTQFRSSSGVAASTLKQKQFSEMKEELSKCKLRQKRMINQQQSKLWSLQKSYQERISNILSICHKQNKQQPPIYYELEQNARRHSEALNKIQYLTNHISTLEKELSAEKLKSQQIQNSVEFFKKTASLQDKDKENVNLQICSEMGSKVDSKADKVLKRVKYENDLLKKELARVRASFDLYQKKENLALKEQNFILRKSLQQAQSATRQSVLELDQTKIENLRLANELSVIKKTLDLAKYKISSSNDNTKECENSSSQAHGLPVSTICQYVIRSLEQKPQAENPFYQLLGKQFKIRYKRCCLKEKDLLFKSDGVEVGVITEFQEPNKIRCIVHIGNIGNERIQRLQIKVVNSSGNAVEVEKGEIRNLEAGEQKKCSVRVVLTRYPVGQTILTYHYQLSHHEEEYRLLLPIPILKAVKIRAIDGTFMNPIIHKFYSQRKILKQFSNISQYFPSATISKADHSVSASVIHEHTETKMLLMLKQLHEGCYEIQYEHRSGEERISREIFRNIKFLLEKD